MDEVERANEVLRRERDAVVTALADAAVEAREAAERHGAWKARVHELLERGRVAGVPVGEMAKALGVSRQWTSHLLSERERADRVRRLLGERRGSGTS